MRGFSLPLIVGDCVFPSYGFIVNYRSGRLRVVASQVQRGSRSQRDFVDVC